MMTLTGSLVALVTPMHDDFTVNYQALDQLLDFHLTHGTDGLVILGTTAEATTLTTEEQEAIVTYTVNKIAGRLPIIVGSGSNDTRKAIALSQTYERLGADGLLVITPYYNKTNEEGLYQHFVTIADAVKIPIILYNVPSRTGMSISLHNIARLAQHANIIGIKEASGDMSYVTALSRYLSDDFVMYSGNDDIILPMLAVGAVGVISVWANLMPQEAHDLVVHFQKGDIEQARDIQQRYLDLINLLFVEVNPIPVKAAMAGVGMAVGPTRLPLAPMAEPNREQLYQELSKFMEVALCESA
jgi:4-hydroxy-tetrahydrodipicolinate synthase